ncbi:MAG: hypothetical protein ACUZ8O_09060 [Candidatus Anammoxibacter sp.]
MKFDFTLHYDGNLKSNGDPTHKHSLRKHFHKQLQCYLNSQPDAVKRLVENQGNSDILRRGFKFIPFIRSKNFMVGQVDIFILQPGPLGSIFTGGGDIDNRLKTLFDSLKVPEQDAIPQGEQPSGDEEPFYCVFEDDRLITKVSVNTAQLLEKRKDDSNVILTIKVVGEETVSSSSYEQI